MASDKKPNRPKARLPRGLADRGPAEIAATRRMIETIREVYERYGFEGVETPAIEYTDALGKFLPDQDRPNEGVFSFQDDDEQWLSLRYDLTAPLARYVAENFEALPKPYRSYRFGWVFRNEKPGPGRFRQFMQFDADTVGSNSPAADAEICMMAADTMEALGIPRGSYVVKVNNRKILDGVLEEIGIGGEENAGKRLTVLRALDKFDRLGADGVNALLTAGRRDESGDFTRGAELRESQAIVLMAFVRTADFASALTTSDVQVQRLTLELLSKWFGEQRPGGDMQIVNNSGIATSSAQPIRDYFVDNYARISKVRDTVGPNETAAQALDEIEHLISIVESAGYGSQRIAFDTSVVRGLEYYTGPVYEVELTFPMEGEDGKPVRFGSVAGGGRYDGLVARFKGQDVPATGFSIGVSRLQAALTHLGKLDSKPEPGPVVVTVFDRECIADYQRMVQRLRNAGIRAELYLGNPKNFGNQLKYADKRNSPCVVIQGGDEKNHPSGQPHVQIKDLILGAEIADMAKDRDDYLQKQSQAQSAVLEEKLVEAVRELLARHGIGATKKDG